MTVEPAAVTGLTGVLAAVVVLVARTELDAVLDEGGGWEERLEVVLFAAGWAWVWGWGWEPLVDRFHDKRRSARFRCVSSDDEPMRRMHPVPLNDSA